MNQEKLTLEEELEIIKNPLALKFLVLEIKSRRHDFMTKEEIEELEKQQFEMLVYKDETSRIQEEFDKREKLLNGENNA